MKVLNKIKDEKLESFFKYEYYKLEVQRIANKEIDTILVLPKYKLIVDIEVKHSPNYLKKASTQTNIHATAFKFISKDWQFIKAACVLDNGKNKPCRNCKRFIIKEKELNKTKDWLKTIIDNRKYYSEYNYEYIDLLFRMNILAQDLSLNKFDLLELSKETEIRLIGWNAAIDGENSKEINTAEYKDSICCKKLTSNQEGLMDDTVSSIIIEGDHGTGKTLTLKKQAKDCATAYPAKKIAYISLTGMQHHQEQFHCNQSLMELITKTTEVYPSNIRVIQLNEHYNISANAEENVREILYQKKYDFAFIDEMPIPNNFPWSSIRDTKFVVTVTKENRNSDCQLQENNKDCKKLFFEYNVRNSENIVNLSKAVSVDNFIYSSRFIVK